jgi:hypothetical protein
MQPAIMHESRLASLALADSNALASSISVTHVVVVSVLISEPHDHSASQVRVMK